MYGNFDGIKDRARLRKEVTDSRLDRLNKLKKIQINSNNKDTFPKISKKQLLVVKKAIQNKLKKEKHQQLVTKSIFIILTSSILFFIWRYIYPFLFN